MKTIALAVVTAALLTVPAGAASAGTTEALGQPCSFASVTDPTDPNLLRQAGELDGGPYVLADLADLVANPVSATLTCSIQVNGSLHSDPDAAVASASGTTVVVLPPTLVTYEASPGDYVVVCTRLSVTDAHGETSELYWTGSRFATSDTSCFGHIDPCLFPCWPLDEVLDLVDGVLVDHVDPALCPVFASQAPGVPGVLDVTPEGDVYVAGEFFWNCPSY